MSACSDRDRKKNEAADSSSSTTTTSSSRRDATLASLWTKLPDTSIRHKQISTAIAKKYIALNMRPLLLCNVNQ